MGRILSSSLLGLLVSVLACGEVWAQGTAQVSGRVLDQSGAALPGVEVKATQTATGLARNTVSDETGAYVLTNLPIGPYRIEATLPGFQTYVQTGIVLQVGSSPVVNPVLEIGQVAETVEVQADAAMVETRNTDIGAVIDNQRVLELPLNGRQATDLVFLTAGATPGTTSGLNSGVRNYPTADISIAGGLASGTIYMLDGGVHNDPFNNQALPLPFPDALQEFRVQTSAIPAQYGHHSAGAVNGVTKSGTNEFHGDLFEFLRDERLNARNAFATQGDGLKRNQFGGTIGGPIVKERLFFFGGLQTTTERRRPTTDFAFIPTAEILAGDFRTITAPPCSVNRITLSAPFVNNQISPVQFNRAAMNILRRSNFPKTSDPCGRIFLTRSASKDQYDVVSRVDFQESANHNLFTRFLAARLDQPSDFSADNMLSYSNARLAMRVYSAVFGDTYVVSPNTVSTFRASLNRGNIPKIQERSFDGPDVGINMWPGVPGVLRLAITNGFTISSNLGTPTKYNHTSFQFGEDVNMVRGRHQFGFGASYVWGSFNGTSGLNASGPFSFNGSVYGHGLADFMLGKPSAFSQSNETNSDPRNQQFGAYIQDTWKVTPKVTLNGGLRWDPFITDYAKRRDWVAHFEKSLFDRGVRSIVYKNAPAGLIFPGDPDYPGDGYWKSTWMHFGPRLGLAWDPAGDGRLSIRAAYGLLYDHPPFGRYVGYSQSAPIGGVINIPFPPSLDDPWANYPGGNPLPIIKDKNFPFAENASFQNGSFDMQPTYSQQWNLSIQRQIGTNLLVSAAYVGTELVHMWTGSEINPGIIIPGGTATNTAANVPSRRLLTLQNPSQGRFYSGGIRTTTSDGTGSFHGMLLTVQRRASSGLTFSGNYTWSHCIQDVIDLGSTTAGVAIRPFDRRSSRSNCDQTDRRHVFNVSTVYATRFSNPILRGWRLSNIVVLRSGQPLNITAGTDRALTGQGGQLADQILASPYTPDQSLNSWLNPAAFAIPALGTYGNMAPFGIQGPGSVRIDMGLTRSFQVRENQSLQLRIEAFNLPNHLNPNNPVTARNNSNFGKIQSAMDPRIMQIAVKYTY